MEMELRKSGSFKKKLVQIYNEENKEKSDIYPFWMSYNQYKVQKQNK